MYSRTRKSLSTLLTVVLVMGASVFGIQSQAVAAVHKGTLYMQSGDGYGTYTVNDGTDTVSLSVHSGALGTDECLSMYVDITRTGGKPEGTHHDILVARTCVPWSAVSVSAQNLRSYGVNVTGVNKLAVCRGTNKSRTDRGLCNNPTADRPTGKITTVNVVAGNPCGRFWVRDKQGVVIHYSGGKPWRCDK